MFNINPPKYYVVQRCRYYGKWPEHLSLDSYVTEFKSNTVSKIKGKIAFHLTTYENRPDFETPPKEFHAGFVSIMGITKEIGFWVGDHLHTEGQVGDGILKLDPRRLKQSELDIIISLNTNEEITVEEVFKILKPYVNPVVMYISGIVQDILVPSQDLIACKYENNNINTNSMRNRRLVIHKRPDINKSQVKLALIAFIQTYKEKSSEEVTILDVAARRIVSAQNESDIIDKYCDLWEACEFLTNAKHAKVDTRISDAISKILNRKASDVRKYVVNPLYKIRKDLVHNAIEDTGKCLAVLPLLEQIALTLFSKMSGLPVIAHPDFVSQVDNCLKDKIPFA